MTVKGLPQKIENIDFLLSNKKIHIRYDIRTNLLRIFIFLFDSLEM